MVTGQPLVGVDTHADVHVAVALDQLGRRLGTLAVPSTPAGYASLEAWATDLGIVEQVGLEGTGCYGAGLSRWLRQHGHRVVEVNRPDRQTRRRRGKSDVVDAEAAARAVQGGTATSTPKSGDGAGEMIRALRVARRSAMKARTQAVNQLKALIGTVPDVLREHIRGLHRMELIRTVTRWRPRAEPDTLATVTKLAMRSIAHRYLQLDDEISELDRHLQRLVTRAAPELMAVKGLGVETVAALLVAVGDTPGLIRSESAFAHLCGVAPIPAFSGKTSRHRLNRGGDRQANHALYMITVSRMAWEPSTRAYMARRTAQGKTKTEIIRCLKRHIAREVYGLLVPRTPAQPSARDDLTTAA
ncbi:IS110 family transposase [Streptomyces sp. NBC_01723]|uniref:IS110 family transposase n=1 Tax=Streptomyces sp. NBC_01723 TaxID=2975921 RepID=UPI002E30F002|nr:IS110 family transposase [Streptomyces sp. NBC_01723]